MSELLYPTPEAVNAGCSDWRWRQSSTDDWTLLRVEYIEGPARLHGGGLAATNMPGQEGPVFLDDLRGWWDGSIQQRASDD